MIVSDLLECVGGNTKILISGTTDKEKYVNLLETIGDDIDFNNIPYGSYEIEHVSVAKGEDILHIILDGKYNF